MFLSDNLVRELAPSVFSDTHDGSELYTHVPTIEIMRTLGEAGYKPTQVMQHNPRKRNPLHTTHLVRMRHTDDAFARGRAEVPEILIMNSHSRERSLSLMGGIFRFACANGLICGESYAAMTLRHIGSAAQQAYKFAETLPDQMRKVEDTFEKWKTVTLEDRVALEFADRAGRLRFRDEEDAVTDYTHLLTDRRSEDQGRDLYRIFNVVQENATKGGRRLKQAKRVVEFNRNLWDLAEEFAEAV